MKLENSFEVPASPEAAWAAAAPPDEADAAVAEQSRPVSVLRLGLAALWRALVRLFRRRSR